MPAKRRFAAQVATIERELRATMQKMGATGLRVVSTRHVADGEILQWSDREVYLLLTLRERVRTGALAGDTAPGD